MLGGVWRKNKALLDQAIQLPGSSSFVSQTGEKEDGEPEYDIDSEGFVSSIDEAGFLNTELSTEQYQLFGFFLKRVWLAYQQTLRRIFWWEWNYIFFLSLCMICLQI